MCAKYTSPRGVVFSLKVAEDGVEPTESNSALNLLSADKRRAALADEPEELVPELAPGIVEPATFACGGKGLAGTTSAPKRSG
jgi:hypothetical protein